MYNHVAIDNTVVVWLCNLSENIQEYMHAFAMTDYNTENLYILEIKDIQFLEKGAEIQQGKIKIKKNAIK